MKTCIDENKNRCIVILDKLKKIDEYEKVIDLSELKNAIKGLELLGKKVHKINIARSTYIDFFNNAYYKKYDEEILNKINKDYSRAYGNYEMCYENNRLYVLYEGIKIICPINMCDMYSGSSDELTLFLYFE